MTELQNEFSPNVRIKFAYGSAILACAAAIIVQTWFATAGTWFTLPTFPYPYDHYYNQLADAFLQGQTHLEKQVNPLLLELPNPYDPEARGDLDFLWDTSLYQGKYYLYWGPFPAVIIMAIKFIYPVAIGDNLVVFMGVALTTIFQACLLTLLWMRYFQRLPIWTLFIGILLAGLVVPFNSMNNRPEIYEGAIISGQAFLMGGVYFALLSFKPNEISPSLLTAASMLWACAVASRTIVMLEIIFASIFICILILNYSSSWAWKSKRIAALGIPLVLCVFSLGVYNFVRFGSLFEFGYNHQLTMFDFSKHGDETFSTQYILPNIAYYTLTPPERISSFPYIRASEGDEIEPYAETPDFYYIEKITGMIYTFPFALFTIVPVFWAVIKMVKSKNGSSDEAGRRLQWICMMLSGMALTAFAHLLTFFFATMRYYADVTPILSVLALIGFWLGYKAVSSNRVWSFAYAGIGILLTGVSIIVPNMLALRVSERFNTYSPQVLPALDSFFKVLFHG